MPVDAKLREMLVCPNCHGKLADQKDEKAEGSPKEGLRCDACKLLFPVKDDIPVMIVNEATKL